jgi:DNA-binding NarL/FixJ family response regulator
MRVLIADDHAPFRNSLRHILQNVEVVGEAANGIEVIKKTQELQPDLILMDVSMPILDGLRASEFVKTHYPSTKILMMSLHKFRELIDQAKKLGLQGYLLKEQIQETLSGAIDAMNQDETFYPDGISVDS